MTTDSKTIIVTGASSGFGKQCALSLIAQGHRVIGGARRVAEMQSLVDAGGDAMVLDITNQDSRQAFIEKIIAMHGRVDTLVNNAGYGVYDFVETADLDQMRAMFEVNLWGSVAMTQAVLPIMRKQASGRIINVSSLAGKVSAPSIGFYAASKHALEAISDAARQELSEFGVDVCLIEPGIFNTGFEDVMFKRFTQLEVEPSYQPQLSRLQQFLTKAYARAPRPDAVIKVLQHAINSARPKTRYIVGLDAKAGITARKYMSDRHFDRLLAQQMANK